MLFKRSYYLPRLLGILRPDVNFLTLVKASSCTSLLKRLSKLRLFSCCRRAFVVRSSFFARTYCFAQSCKQMGIFHYCLPAMPHPDRHSSLKMLHLRKLVISLSQIGKFGTCYSNRAIDFLYRTRSLQGIDNAPL